MHSKQFYAALWLFTCYLLLANTRRLSTLRVSLHYTTKPVLVPVVDFDGTMERAERAVPLHLSHLSRLM